MKRILLSFGPLLLCLALCLGLWLGASGGAGAQAGYSLVRDTATSGDFSGANTSFGSGANSTTGVPGGWIDFTGNVYHISSAKLTGIFSGGYVVPTALYRPSGENYQNGKVRVYNSGNSTAAACVARFNPASGGSGYGCMFYTPNNTFYFYKDVAGTPSVLTTVVVNGAIPNNFILDFYVSSTSASASTLTGIVYDPAAPNTVVYSASTTDSTAGLQATGAWGVGVYNTSTYTGAQTYQIPGGAIASGQIQAGYVSKTVANVIGYGAAGGTAPYTYQWQRSLSSSSGYASVAGATSLTLRDTGLTPNTPYFYRLVATDSTAGTTLTVTSNTVALTTFTTSAVILGFVGDSITYGSGSSGANAVQVETSALNAGGVQSAAVNRGVGGSKSGDWISGSANLNAALTAFVAGEVNTVSVMLGANDSKAGNGQTPTPAATYKSNLSSAITATLATSGITKVFLNYPTYIIPGSGGGDWGTGAADPNPYLTAYQPQIDSLVNGTTIRQGDTTAYAHFQSTTGQLSDGVHPNTAGHAFLGAAWEAPVYAYFNVPLVAPAGLSGAAGGVPVTLTWNAVSGTVAGYRLYKDGGGTALYDGAALSYTDAVPLGSTHSYTVSAYNGGGESAKGTTQTVTTVMASTPFNQLSRKGGR